MTDPLSTPISSTITPATPWLSSSWEPELFFDGDRFMQHLATFDCVDVATFSLTRYAQAPLHNVRRLITGLRFYKSGPIKCKSHKLIINNHCKLFICYRGEPPSVASVFVGSQNLTHGTNINLSYRVREEHVSVLVNFFETLWNSK